MKSWIESANTQSCHFPIQNLPYGVFSTAGSLMRCGVAIGDYVLDLAAIEQAGLLTTAAESGVFNARALNDFMGLGPSSWKSVRGQLTALLRDSADSRLKDDSDLCQRALIPLTSVSLHLPFKVSEYTDFYASRDHAVNVGTMFRGAENALPPNWLHIPIGYNGRASTVVVSGTDVRRPLGQTKAKDSAVPEFGPCQRLDIELEMAAVVGTPSEMGQPVSVAQAQEMIFGYVLLNDWSARDIQAWEYQPLGPFQAKAFASTISPWVVTREALEPFRVSTPEREIPLLPYLQEPGDMLYDINLEVYMQPDGASESTRISKTNYSNMYYSFPQQLAHHALCGCKMNTGDMLGSGTISGPGIDQRGSLLELSWGGRDQIELANGVTRSFIEDGDTLTLRGWALGENHIIGFGDCAGKIIPAVTEPNW